MNILRRQSLRNLKSEWFKYLAVFLLIVGGLTLIISISDATDSISCALEKLEKDSNVEDGNFSVFVPLSNSNIEDLKKEGVQLEECFYVDVKDKSTDATIRVFKNREYINLLQIKEGKVAENDDEIVMEQHYAQNHSLKIGDKIKLDGREYKIVGFGYSIDYDSLLEQADAAYPNSEVFGTAFVTEDAFAEFTKDNKAEYNYSFKLNGEYDDRELFDWLSAMQFDESKVSDKYMQKTIDDVNDEINEFRDGADDVVSGAKDLYDSVDSLGLPMGQEELSGGAKDLYDSSKELRDAVYDVADEYLTVEWENLISFTTKSENRRIMDYRDFASTNKYCSLPIGAALFLSLSFIVAVIAANDIKKQSRTIGTLYAMGYKSNELAATFIVVPVLVVFFASIVGTVLGFNSISLFTKDYVANGCIVDLPTAYPVYLLLYGLLVPTVLALIVNWIVIKYTLSKPVLHMLKNTSIETKNLEIGLANMKFKKKYQFRQFFREMPSYLLLFVSLVMTIFMMVFSVTLFGTLDTWVNGCDEDIHYEYKYYYKFPSEDVPEDGEAVFYKALQANLDLTDSAMDVEVWGLQKNSKYFDYDLEGSKSDIYITDSTQSKFGWEVGDKIYLSNKQGTDSYCFTVAGVVDFSTGLYLYMDIDNMREVFDEEDDYWNLVLADKKLNIDNNRLAATISKDDVVIGAQRRTDSLMGIVYMLMGMGIFVFVGIFFLMMKMLVEKSLNSISLLKIMGYKQREVVQLYLVNPFIIVVLSSAVSIPFSKWLVSIIYPLIISSVTTGMPVVLPIPLFALLVGIIFVSWFATHLLLKRKINKILPTEILRSNE